MEYCHDLCCGHRVNDDRDCNLKCHTTVISMLCFAVSGCFFTYQYFWGCSIETRTIDPYLYNNFGFPKVLQDDFKLSGDKLYSCGAFYTAPDGVSPQGRPVYGLDPCRLLMFDSEEWAVDEGYERQGMHCQLMNMVSVGEDGSQHVLVNATKFEENFTNKTLFAKMGYCDGFTSSNGGGETTLFMLSCPTGKESLLSMLEFTGQLIPLALIVALALKMFFELGRTYRKGYKTVSNHPQVSDVEMVHQDCQHF